MRIFLSDNISKFDASKDHDYLFTKDHQLRSEILIKLIEEVVSKKINQPQRILSIACSTGVIEEKIKNKFNLIVFGIDGAKKSLKIAQRRGIIVKHADISADILPFENSYFDFVFAGEIIEHIFDTRFFLEEIHRVLKTNGYLILSTPNLARLDDRLKFLLGKTPRQIAPFHPYLYLHIRPFTFELLKKSLLDCGFTEITLKTNVIALKFFGRELKIYSKFLTNIFPTFGVTLIVRAKKK